MPRFRSERPAGNGSRIATLLWSAWAFGAVAVMIGLAPVRASSGTVPSNFRGSGPESFSWTDSRCNQCHEIDPVFSHPVGFRPSRALPEHFPLQGGKMTCLTCHDGTDSATHAQARTAHEPMLRSPFEGRAFCNECHTDGAFSSTSPHASAVNTAHLMWPDDRPERGTRSASAGLDAESGSCMECHDGTLATGVGSGHSGGDLFRNGFGQEHPVGVVYRSVGDGKDMNRMVHPHALDTRVRLYDGTVGCGSCHSVYSPIENDLVMSNQRSALCLSCHDG